MNKSSFPKTFDRFSAEMALYGSLAADIRSAGFKVTGGDTGKHKLVEALAAKVYAAWEVFSENLLIDCLNRDTSQYAEHKGMHLSKHLSRDVCELMVTGFGYLDVKDVGSLKGLARKIISPQYNAFDKVAGDDAQSIDDFCKIRNYLAHGSRQAKSALGKVYQDKHGLRKFLEPGKFLFAFDPQTTQGKETRLAVYLKAFSNAANAMEDHLSTKL